MVYTFAATIASFVDDEWNLIERVVDFKPLEDKEHEGYHAARAFIKGARDIGGLNKMSRHSWALVVHRCAYRHITSQL
jgi:hypothetical protein